jgi:hypothetical protein
MRLLGAVAIVDRAEITQSLLHHAIPVSEFQMETLLFEACEVLLMLQFLQCVLHFILYTTRVRQANFLFHMAFHIQKRKLACRTLYKQRYISWYINRLGFGQAEFTSRRV